MPPAVAAESTSQQSTSPKKAIAMVVPVRSNRGNVSIPLADDKWKVVGDLLLLAGPNMVPAEKWEQAKRQPMVQALLAERIKSMKAEEFTKAMGHTVGKTVLEEGRPVPADAPLSGMNETDACALVADIADQTLLQTLRRSESRVAVRRAIEARIEAIKDPAKAANAAEASAGSMKAQITTE
jgi:hypothetical protein